MSRILDKPSKLKIRVPKRGNRRYRKGRFNYYLPIKIKKYTIAVFCYAILLLAVIKNTNQFIAIAFVLTHVFSAIGIIFYSIRKLIEAIKD